MTLYRERFWYTVVETVVETVSFKGEGGGQPALLEWIFQTLCKAIITKLRQCMCELFSFVNVIFVIRVYRKLVMTDQRSLGTIKNKIIIFTRLQRDLFKNDNTTYTCKHLRIIERKKKPYFHSKFYTPKPSREANWNILIITHLEGWLFYIFHKKN